MRYWEFNICVFVLVISVTGYRIIIIIIIIIIVIITIIIIIIIIIINTD